MSDEQQTTDEMSELRKMLSTEMDKNRELKEKMQEMREALLVSKEYVRSDGAIALIDKALGIKNE